MPPPPESAAGRRRKTLSIVLACAAGVALIAVAVIWGTRSPTPQTLPKVVVGTRDEIYYSHAATKEDAVALGQALQATGFLNDRGTTVLLSKGTAGTIVSFALNEGAWDRADTVLSFEEIGRRIANSVGGFPLKVRLIDAARSVHKELNIGRVIVGGRDEVYYFGSATQYYAEVPRARAHQRWLPGWGRFERRVIQRFRNCDFVCDRRRRLGSPRHCRRLRQPRAESGAVSGRAADRSPAAGFEDGSQEADYWDSLTARRQPPS